MTTSQFDDLGQGNVPPDRLCLWITEVLHHDCQDLNVLPVTWGTFTSSSCHWCCRWQMMTTWTNAPSTDICLDSLPESCSWDSEGLEELCTSPVPGDNVSGFLLCSVGEVSSTDVNQNYSRTSSNQDGKRYSAHHSLCCYWTPCFFKDAKVLRPG